MNQDLNKFFGGPRYSTTPLVYTVNDIPPLYTVNDIPPLYTVNDIPVETSAPVAIKHDAGKIDWSILPIGASKEIIKVFSFGEQKYARGNYLNGGGLKYSRVINSLLRHIHSFMEGEDLDPETGLSHLAHAGCNIYMLLSYELNKDKFNNDDREAMVLK